MRMHRDRLFYMGALAALALLPAGVAAASPWVPAWSEGDSPTMNLPPNHPGSEGVGISVAGTPEMSPVNVDTVAPGTGITSPAPTSDYPPNHPGAWGVGASVAGTPETSPVNVDTVAKDTGTQVP